MQFGTGTTVGDMNRYPEWLAIAEDAGFDLLTTGDSQSLWADPFISMTLAAHLTTRPRLAITVSNPMTRHPAVVASSCLALQQISGDRFVYGLSSGDSALRNIGVRSARVGEMEQYIRAIKESSSGQRATWRDAEFTVGSHQAALPVWVAAEGPRTQEMAGRVADGVILSNSLTPEVIEIAKANIARGAASVGRRIEDIELWWMCNLVPAKTEDEGIDSIKSVLAGTANHVYRFDMAGKGLPEEAMEPVRRLQSEYDSSHHASPATAAHNAALIDRYGLRDVLAPRSTIAGPTGRILERLDEVAEAGATNLILAQFVDDPYAFMRTFADEIAPHVK